MSIAVIGVTITHATLSTHRSNVERLRGLHLIP